MFELHVVVAAVIMSNILELLMEILPNYPTVFMGNDDIHESSKAGRKQSGECEALASALRSLELCERELDDVFIGELDLADMSK
jgi:hypothetical protein